MFSAKRSATYVLLSVLVLSTAACGTDPTDRTVSGAGIGAGAGVGAAILGAPLIPALLVGGAVGAATGALTTPDQIK